MDAARDAWAAEWLADVLAAAFVLPSWRRCHECPRMSRDACRECWLEEAQARFTPAEEPDAEDSE